MDVQWFTLNGAVTKETTVSESSHTVDHCRLQMNSQWSTVDCLKVQGITLTSVTLHSKLLGM